MTEELQKAKRMGFRLYALGQKDGITQAGEIAQLLSGNSISRNDKVMNLIKLCQETAESKSPTAPINKTFKLFMKARLEISRPFQSRGDCLQSCIYDVLLCYMSFWGQVFEYYETMYYKPVELADGTVDSSPATVDFEVGWLICCCFIRDLMLSSSARSIGVASGYDRSMSWYFYPANATSELDEAKSIVLTVIAKIRKRGTALVAAEGTLGHISFSNSVALMNWVEDNLAKDWSNTVKLEQLTSEYFESTSIRMNVNVTPVAEQANSVPVDDALNTSFGPETSFLDGIVSDDAQTSFHLSVSSRSISINIRPISPAILGSPSCEWSGIDMGGFCREIMEMCNWPEVVNTVSTAGQIGISVINMNGDVIVSAASEYQKRKSFSAPSRLSLTPEKASNEVLLPFTLPTPAGMPTLEPLRSLTTPPPTFGGFIPIPQLTPTPIKDTGIVIPELTPTPVLARRPRDSEVTFCGGPLERTPGTVSPLERSAQAGGVLVALPSDGDFDFTSESPNKMRRISNGSTAQPAVVTRPSTVEVSARSCRRPDQGALTFVAECLSHASDRELSSKNWSIDTALGQLGQRCKSLSALYMHVVSAADSMTSSSVNQNIQDPTNDEDSGRKRKKRSSSSRRGQQKPVAKLPNVSSDLLSDADKRLMFLIEAAEKRSLKSLGSLQRNTLRYLCRVLTLGSVLSGLSVQNDDLKSIIAVASDFVCFCSDSTVYLPQTDVYATGLRSAYVDANISMIETARDLGHQDWLSLGLYYNDVAFALLMGPTGLFQPNMPDATKSGKSSAPQKLIALTVWEKLPQHCLLVCSELLMRWAWAPSSRLWDIYQRLRRDYLNKRHECQVSEKTVSAEELDELNYFIKQCLLNAGTYLCDLGDRLGAPQLVIHGAFDLMRSTILIRPEILRSRHLYQVVFCCLINANTVLNKTGTPVDYNRVGQAAVVIQPDNNTQIITSKFILKSIPITSNDGASLGSDGSGALVFPDMLGNVQPEFEQLGGDLKKFNEKVFVPDMTQVLYNLKKVTMRFPIDHPRGDLGPFIDGQKIHDSVSPLSYPILSTYLAVALQQSLAVSDAQFKTVKAEQIRQSIPYVSPLASLPCLLPPFEAYHPATSSKGDRYYRWFDDTVIKTTKNGIYSTIAIEDN